MIRQTDHTPTPLPQHTHPPTSQPTVSRYGVPYTLYGEGAQAPIEAANEIHPLLELDGVIGALHTPRDGIVNPSDACMHIVRLAREAGVCAVMHPSTAHIHCT